MRVVLLWIAALLLPALAHAQSLAPPHAELPSADQPVRQARTTGYTLALSWAPEFCHSLRGDRASNPECRRGTGFTLHGLWPDGDGPNRWPQYCKPVSILTERQLEAGIAVTPSRQLLQHEWAKHGSCMGDDPVAYFQEEARLFGRVRTPDMRALAARRGITARDVQAAFAAANPGMRPGMVRVDVNKRGWLEEVWLCLGLDRRPRPCPAGQGGAAPGRTLRIEPPGAG